MQRFRRSTVNCLRRLPQLSIGNCQVDSAAAVPVNCFGFIEAGHDVAAAATALAAAVDVNVGIVCAISHIL